MTKHFIFALKSLNLDEIQMNNIDQIKDIKTWYFEDDSTENDCLNYDNWIRNLIITLTKSVTFKDEICIVCKPLFETDVILKL